MESDRRSKTSLAEAEVEGTPRGPDVDRLVRLARETFGSDEKAQRWLRRPTQALSGCSPLDVSTSGASGLERVVDLLKRIDHGLSV